MEKRNPESEQPLKSSFQCVDAIEISLFVEKEGLFFYESLGKKTKDPRVRQMFSHLADEEREHIQTLQEKSRYLQPAIAGQKRDNANLSRFINEELKGKIFPPLTGSADKILMMTSRLLI